MKQGIGAALCLILAAVVFGLGYFVGKNNADFAMIDVGGVAMRYNRATGETWIFVRETGWIKTQNRSQ